MLHDCHLLLASMLSSSKTEAVDSPQVMFLMNLYYNIIFCLRKVIFQFIHQICALCYPGSHIFDPENKCSSNLEKISDIFFCYVFSICKSDPLNLIWFLARFCSSRSASWDLLSVGEKYLKTCSSLAVFRRQVESQWRLKQVENIYARTLLLSERNH